MKLILRVAALAGLSLMVALIAYYGITPLSEALATIGWGLVAVCAFHAVPLMLSAIAWRSLVMPVSESSFPVLVGVRWIREGVDHLLPLTQAGGELVGARILTLRGMPAGTACASVVVDMTLETVSQLVFTLIGLALLILYTGNTEVAVWIFAGLVVASCTLAAFVLAQRKGLFKLLERAVARLAEHSRWIPPGRLDGFHAAVVCLYQNPAALSFSTAYHLLSWIVSAGEVWSILYFMGIPITPGEALLLESLAHAVRTAAFIVPGAWGVQEGTYVILGGMLGLSPQTCLALSLIKRVRELALGLPALLAWQYLEGTRLWDSSYGKRRNRVRIPESDKSRR